MKRVLRTLFAVGLFVAGANAQVDPLFRVFLDRSGNAGSNAAPHPGSGTLRYGNPVLPIGGGRLYIYGEFQLEDQTILSPNFDITIDGGIITSAWNYNGPGQDTLTGDRRWDEAAPNPVINPGRNTVTFNATNLTHMGLKNGFYADFYDIQHDNTRGQGDTLLGYIDVEGTVASIWLTVGKHQFAILGGGLDSPIAFGYGDASVLAGRVGVRTRIAEATIAACPCACDFDTSTGPSVCDLIDFTTFAGLFATGDPCACDMDTSTGMGVCDLIDFTTFAGQFAAGCP